jgi:cyclophilin family peptidyl-prolyl cis-trans isomerase
MDDVDHPTPGSGESPPSSDAPMMTVAARRRRLLVLGVIGVALALLIGSVWLLPLGARTPARSTSASRSSTPSPTSTTDCEWQTRPATTDFLRRSFQEVGTPPAHRIPHSGQAAMGIATDLGEILILMDMAKTPCTVASFAYLASQHFYDGTICKWVGIDSILCGDSTGVGYGNPTYQYRDEDLDNLEWFPDPSNPVTPSRTSLPIRACQPDECEALHLCPPLPEACTEPPDIPGNVGWIGTGYIRIRPGTVHMQVMSPNSNGSQFMIELVDQLDKIPMTQFGRVVAGFELLMKAAPKSNPPVGANPVAFRITSMRVGW